MLFAPGNRPDVVAKLPRSGPDGVIVDLEDAVQAAEKVDARAVTRAATEVLTREHPELAVHVRVNAVQSEWFPDDVASLGPWLAGVVVPKVESPEQVTVIADALARTGVAELGVIAGIETAAGVHRVDSLLTGPVTAAYFGAEDFIVDMGGVRTSSNLEVLYARSRVALACRVAGVLALDQVVTAFNDDVGFERDAAVGRSIGYAGKLCIHPRQVPLANAAFSPSADEVAAARRLLDAFDASDGVVVVDGQMVDEPMARRARAVIAAAED
ncbi:MAG TPA: CoA ester lyase [Acidimicrobiia bacterium]|nr:CoA ester lyase [Acidimicrobiia bacterium]